MSIDLDGVYNPLYEYYKAQEMPRKNKQIVYPTDPFSQDHFMPYMGAKVMINGEEVDIPDGCWAAGVDWSTQPDVNCWYEREVFIAPGEAPQIKYRKLPNQKQFAENAISSRDNAALPSHNMAMIHADIYGDAEKRFRPCQNCHEDFRYKSDDDWLCAPCKGLRTEMERRQGVEGDLLNANGKFK